LLSIGLLFVGLLAREIPGARSAPQSREHRFPARFAIADFDGDLKPDLATVNINRSNNRLTDYSIHLRLSIGPESVIGITAPMGGLQIFSSDVNGDRNLDLVVRTSLESSLVAVLLNDGHGKFTMAEPEAFPGLQNEAELYAVGATRRLIERVSLLPPRNSLGEGTGSVPGMHFQVVAERPLSQNGDTFYSFLVESSFGRSPPRDLSTC